MCTWEIFNLCEIMIAYTTHSPPPHTHTHKLPIVVLGNKRDLNAIREVPENKTQQWARSHGVKPYEVTVLDRDSLKDPFSYIAWRMANPGVCVCVCVCVSACSV